MWQDDAANLLRGELEGLLSQVGGNLALRKHLGEAVAQTERPLAGEAVRRRPEGLVPLVVCDAISGHYEQALPVAAAMRFFRAAADVFDDVEDADSPTSLAARYGVALATNVATGLLILGEKAIARLVARGVAGGLVVRVFDAVNSYHLTACGGQHEDLSSAPGTPVSEEEYLEIAARKSASQVECTFLVGALVAGARSEIASLFATLGRNYGMAAQIANDIQGTLEGTDILRRKMTLPAIYALAQTDGEAHSRLEAALDPGVTVPPDVVQVRQLLFDVGAIHYAMLKMDMYKQSARDTLSRIRSAGIPTERLQTFLGLG